MQKSHYLVVWTTWTFPTSSHLTASFNLVLDYNYNYGSVFLIHQIWWFQSEFRASCMFSKHLIPLPVTALVRLPCDGLLTSLHHVPCPTQENICSLRHFIHMSRMLCGTKWVFKEYFALLINIIWHIYFNIKKWRPCGLNISFRTTQLNIDNNKNLDFFLTSHCFFFYDVILFLLLDICICS